MDAILEVGVRNGVAVVEDACQALGAEDRGRRAGSLGDAAAFSFGPGSSLSTYGEAGAVTTNSRSIAEQVQSLRDHGRTPAEFHSVGAHGAGLHGPEVYGTELHGEIGLNSRLDEIHAVILRTKLRLLDTWNDRRRAHAATYRRLLTGQEVTLPTARRGTKHIYQSYIIQLEEQLRDEVQGRLAALGVETAAPCRVPTHQQPAMRNVSRTSGALPVTDALSRSTLSLPLYPELTTQQLAYVSASLGTQPRLAH